MIMALLASLDYGFLALLFEGITWEGIIIRRIGAFFNM